MKAKLHEIFLDLISYLKENPENQFSLLNGNCGIFLLLFLYAKKYNLDLSEHHLDALFTKSLTETFNRPSMNFSDGISGIGWMLQMLVDEEIVEYDDVKKVLEQMDGFSRNFALQSITNNNHDFLYGAVGEMVYLLSRINYNDDVKNSLAEIGGALIEKSEKSENGIYWKESEFMLEEYQKDNEVVNLGISHGQASKIFIFTKLIESGIEVDRYGEVLSEVVNYILRCKNKYTEKTMFPGIIENNKGHDSAFWWSYGDLGIGIALYQAGEALQDSEIKNLAERIFIHYRNTKIEETGMFEASLCRGTSGVALMYHNMFVNTGNTSLRKTSNYWFDETIKLAKFDRDSIAGFKYLNNHSPNRNEWYYQSNPNLLMGTAGVGLALLSKLSRKKLAWSRCLLLN